MKRIVIVIGLCMGIGLANLSALDTDDLNQISFVNNLSGGKEIQYLFCQATDSAYWGTDVLGSSDSLGNKKKAEFYIYYPESKGHFNFLAIDEDGKTYRINNVEVIDGTEKTVTFTDRNKSTDAFDEDNLVEVIFTNETDYEMNYVFFAPADTNTWGIEILNTENSLPSGDEISFYVFRASKTYSMDFKSIDEDGDEYEKSIKISPRDDTVNASITDDDWVDPDEE